MNLKSRGSEAFPITDELVYPCLVKVSDCVVLMVRYGCGTVVLNRSKGGEVGFYSNSWNMGGLKPYYGHIILEQNP